MQVVSSSSAVAPYQASAATTDGFAWLSVSPATGSASSGTPGQSTVSVNPNGLAPGVYRGGVSYAFSSDSVRTVNVTLLVGSAGISAQTSKVRSAARCIPDALIATQVGLPNNFQQTLGWTALLTVAVIDDCGAPVTNASVSASFSNGDPKLILYPVGSAPGRYSTSWTPRAISSQVTVASVAAAIGFAPGAPAQITGQVIGSSAPLVTPGGVLNIFRTNLGDPLAPGAVVQIYGSNLAAGAAIAPSLPLPRNLGGTWVLIGGIAAPLFYVSPGQINAQVPFELAPGRQYQVQVNANGSIGAPEPFTLVPAAPALAAQFSGAVIAQHADYTLITDSAPARPGEYIAIYLAGLGMPDTSLADGAASPSAPLAHPATTPAVTINGNPVAITFCGLTPGAVGLYQINLQVPIDLPGGPATLVVSQSGLSSNAVTLPVSQ